MKIKFLTLLAVAAVAFMAACGKSDADLAKAVNDKLAADKVTGITAAVNSGVATLTGEVTDITVKNKAEASAKAVEGIKSVTNNVTVKAPPPPPPSPDKMIEGTVNEAIKKLGITGVTVTVADGVVTLSGEVTGRENLAKVMQAANEAKPKKVENKLTVK
ncbi:MAG: BON domain-containing protein [Blastocatellia bacterium]|nr:BON domain-containing protein [Chloracidobacterium sp.]MBL8186218.1 BON domain-containing protein [Blastocatellia bacterium]HRJ88207.1 BON domain-containing protein [Pyrinomonadaceae bacterium]HRK49273.1 BON domain-containing protein [Pyrinomonadaceae bacterium]